jgi:hypothetical protein
MCKPDEYAFEFFVNSQSAAIRSAYSGIALTQTITRLIASAGAKLRCSMFWAKVLTFTSERMKTTSDEQMQPIGSGLHLSRQPEKVGGSL